MMWILTFFYVLSLFVSDVHTAFSPSALQINPCVYREVYHNSAFDVDFSSYNFGRCPESEIAVQWNNSDSLYLKMILPYTKNSVNFTLTVGECVLQFEYSGHYHQFFPFIRPWIAYGIPYGNRTVIEVPIYDAVSYYNSRDLKMSISDQLPLKFGSNDESKADRMLQPCKEKKMHRNLDNTDLYTTISLQQFGFSKAILQMTTERGTLKEYHSPNFVEVPATTKSSIVHSMSHRTIIWTHRLVIVWMVFSWLFI
ncbi:hypothetical protein M3Y95_00850300 [Aphelenchoides besseyi]|nr:hypothetical protein M3Y95_00850300 [Aphelenchoides besseyi]